jgi:hypothetical protein
VGFTFHIKIDEWHGIVPTCTIASLSETVPHTLTNLCFFRRSEETACSYWPEGKEEDKKGEEEEGEG